MTQTSSSENRNNPLIMSPVEKGIHRFLISALFTLLNWVIVDNLIVTISFWKYLIVEVLLVVSMKFSIFTTRKLKL